MKKVISIFLAALMLCSLFVITAGAEIYDEDFTPGVVVAGVEFDAPSIETLLKDFEIEEATETVASCVHNTYLVKFKEKTKEIVLRAIEVLEKSSYVLYAAPEYIYQEVGSTEPVTSEPVTEKPSDSAENKKISDETAKKIAENSESLLPVYIFLQVDFKQSEVEKYVLDNVEGAKTDADIFLKYYRAEVRKIISPQVQKFVDDNKDYIENIRFQSDSTGLVIADVYAYNIEKIAQHDRVTQISYYDDVPDGNDIKWLYEDKFLEQYNINKEKLNPYEYSYSELYYHTNDKEEIDWVLVDAYVGCPADAETTVFIGDVYGREIFSVCIYYPFETRYGVYDVKEGKFYDIKDYQNVPDRMYELISVLKELNIGEEVNVDPTPPTEPATTDPVVTTPSETIPETTEPTQSAQPTLVDTQAFIDALKPYFIYHYYYKTNPELTLDTIRKCGIRFFEENDKRVVFGLVSSINSELYADSYCTEKIGDYEFISSGFFSENSKNVCGYFVYQDGKLYTLSDAVEQGVVDVNEMAKIIPNTKKAETLTDPIVTTPEVTEPVTPPAVTDPTQPSSTSSNSKVTSKKTNPIKVSVKTKTLKVKKLKKKAQKVKAITVKNNVGKVTYKLVKKGISKKIRKLCKINSKGVITIKKWKKAKKGAYRIKVKITAAGNKNYNAKTITKTVKVKIK